LPDAEPQSKHGAKPENRRNVLEPFGIAAIRFLILTGIRQREVLDLEWRMWISSGALCFCRIARPPQTMN